MQVLSLLWFFGIAVGHVAILCYSNNWWFSHPYPRRIMTGIRLLHGLLVVLGLAAVGWLYLAYWSTPQEWLAPSAGRSVVAAYALACTVVGLGVVPAVTIGRNLRRRSASLLANHTHTVNLEAKLGYKPTGRSKYQLLGRLPGNQIFQVDFAERTLCLPRLPRAWDGLSILHLSDLHFGGTPDKAFYQGVMDLCQEWEPDLLAFTGDIVDSDSHHRWILPVLGRLRWRLAAFGILGNHDVWFEPGRVRRRLGKIGIRVLGNSWEQLDVRGEPLTVIGHEGPWFRPEPDLSGCPADGFRLCLSHTPDNIRWAQEHKIDLMLAGHTHGGQIRFPIVGSLLVPSRYGRRYDCGTFSEPPTVMHVSRGLAGQHPVRYLCRPEVTRIVLKAQA
jgi:predicted MPP superfamily phosphohydrolase